MTDSRKLSVFLCHASQDKPIVRDLYQRLINETSIDPWLDEEKLLPGQDWDLEIERAVEQADVVIVCLSTHSVSKEGYVQRELKFVLDIALEKPEGTIFVIPLRLDDCPVPRRLRSWQYVDYFPQDYRKRAYQRLFQSLRARYDQLVMKPVAVEEEERHDVQPAVSPMAEKISFPKSTAGSSTLSGSTNRSGFLELAEPVLPILFFGQLAPFLFGQYDDISEFFLTLTTTLFGGFLAYKRQLVENPWLKFATMLFVAIHSLSIYTQNTGWEISDFVSVADGLVALLVGILYIVNFKAPRQTAPYAAAFFATFLLIFALKLLLNLLGIYPDWIHTPMLIAGFIAAIFLWLER